MKNCNAAALPARSKRLRLPGLLFFVSFLSLIYATPAQAEGEEVLDKKITLIVEQKEVRDVLSEISKLVEIKFVYSAQKIPSRKKVSVLANDQRVGDILNSLLEPLNVLYYVSGNQVVLMQKGEE
ncbi:MAG TPA: STN domain-containing protein, partial [Chitinophagaceae bacterium]|nr:STN domain-containing protein [Chitinophagaceae bacterium]